MRGVLRSHRCVCWVGLAALPAPSPPREEGPAMLCDRAASMWLLTGPGGSRHGARPHLPPTPPHGWLARR